MKRDAMNHTKMKRLCRALNLPLWQAVGLLESLWHTTARQAPRGDIGQLTDADIALAIEYMEDEEVLINTLLACGWLDASQEYRLIVHDWSEHAEDSVHMKLARARKYFVSAVFSREHGMSTESALVAPKLSRLPSWERENAEKYYENAGPRREHGVSTNGQNVSTAGPRREHGVSTNGQNVSTAGPRREHGVMGPSPALTPPLEQNTVGVLENSGTEQHHHPISDDDVARYANTLQTAARLTRLSRADVRFCGELIAAGVDVARARDGILVGLVRRKIHEVNSKTSGKIKSLRYFAGVIEESQGGLFPPGYADHAMKRLEHEENRNAEHPRA